MRIVFMGTPEFAVASLDALLQAGCNVVAVITAPDKPSGRGMKMNESAVKKYAIEKNIPILQPEKLKNPEFLEELKSFKADLQIVVAFRMLPEVVWNMPSMGTINVHGSLLPQYRGAAPINWAVINGEKETGVTTFKLKHEIDYYEKQKLQYLVFPEGMLYNKKNDTVRTNRINTLFREIAILSKVLEETKNDNPFLDCHFGSNVGTTAGSSDFLEDVEMLNNLKNDNH